MRQNGCYTVASGGTKRALVNPCNDAHMSIKIFREGLKVFGKVNSKKKILVARNDIELASYPFEVFFVFADQSILQESY